MSVAEGAATRAELRRVAAGLFAAKGYEATTMRDLAAGLNIKPASIYYHFSDKEEILYEIVLDTLDLSRRGITAALDRETEPRRRLATLVVHHVVFNATRPREATLAETELRSLTGDRLAAVLASRDGHDRLVLDELARGAAAGAFVLLDPKLTTYAVVSMCLNVGSWYRDGGRLTLDEVAETYAELALRLVAASPLPTDDVRVLARDAIAFYAS